MRENFSDKKEDQANFLTEFLYEEVYFFCYTKTLPLLYTENVKLRESYITVSCTRI
jgi:hypothetical protein